MENQKLDILHSSFLFCGLPLPQLQILAQKAHIRTHKKGRLIIEEDVINDKIGLIISGLVKIYKLTHEGKEVFLSVEKPGDYLGVMDLNDMPATATVEALEEVKVMVIQKKELRALLSKDSFLWENMYRVLVGKLKTQLKMQRITQHTTLYQKTYLALDFLSRISSNNVISLSHEALAQIVGATRPRVTEVLHILQKEKKIAISSKRITLLS